MIGVLLLFLSTYEGCSSRTVMTIGNIHRWHLCKLIGDGLRVCIVVDYPELMTEAIYRCDKVILWLCGCITHDELVEHSIVGIGKEHWFDIGIVNTYMLHSVFLLITTGELMLLDTTCHIVIGMCTYHKTILGLTVHRLSIYIIMFARILNEPALVLELLEVLCSLLIHSRVIL